MDITEEIDKHLEWIETIVSLLGSEKVAEETLPEITRHDRCALGQWLISEASTEFRDLPELESLKESHEAFHRLAGDMISALAAGDEEKAVDSEKRFIEKSQEVISYLQVLQERRTQDGKEKSS